MGRDSSGTYSRTQSDYSFNTVISETQINSELNDIKAEITASLEASGKKAWTGNQNAGATKITALAVGTALTDSTTLGQVQNAGMQYAAGSGTNTITAAMAPAITAYAAGQTFRIKMAAGANTGGTTLNLNSVGAKAITKAGTTALAAGDIPASAMFEVAYDGTQFQLINVAAGSGGIASLAADSSPQLGADLDCNGSQIQWSKGSDVASATALPLLTDGNYFDVTGTATVTSFNATGGPGTQIKLHFDAACTLTHNSDLILPGGANIVTAAGDEADFIEFAAGDYRCTSYTKATGGPVLIPANSIDSDAYVDGSIDEAHLSDNSVDSRAYVDGSIDLAHMSVNSIDSDQYVDGSIDLAHMSANSVDSDQYVNGSIDEVHLSDNSVDSRAYADASIDSEHLSAGIILNNVLLKDYGEVTNAIGSTGGGTQAIDLTLGNSVSATVDTSTNTFTFTNPTASDELCGFTLMLTNGGSKTVNWPSTVDFAAATAPTLTPSGVDCLVFWTIDGGTIWNGAPVALTLS